MNKTTVQILVLAAIIMVVHIFYVLWVFPEVALLENVSQMTGSILPRTFFIIVKDLEQEICLMLFFWGLYLSAQQYMETAAHVYLFDVDFLKDIAGEKEDVVSTLQALDNLPVEVKNAAVVKTISSALRRYIITGSVQNASESITPALEAMAVKHEADLSIVKYIAWAIPSIGFLGTVRGIGMAMSEAETAVAGNIGPMTESLGTAFNSTFVALLASVFIMFVLSFLQRAQDEQLVKVQEYCEKYLIERISMKTNSSA
jgi:biopolymer transport protein ExbB/TolQ